MNPEKKFWYEIKAFNLKNNCELSFTRVENSAAHGTPDLLGYNTSGHFFTVELKLKKAKKISFSPHQIGFHLTHPNNSFIMLKALGPLAIKLYEGKDILELVAKGHGQVKHVACGLEACGLWLQRLGPGA